MVPPPTTDSTRGWWNHAHHCRRWSTLLQWSPRTWSGSECSDPHHVLYLEGRKCKDTSNVHIRTYTCTHSCTYVRILAHTHVRTYVYLHTLMYVRTYTCTHSCTYVRILAHTHVHTLTHTHVHILTQTYSYVLTHTQVHKNPQPSVLHRCIRMNMGKSLPVTISF